MTRLLRGTIAGLVFTTTITLAQTPPEPTKAPEKVAPAPTPAPAPTQPAPAAPVAASDYYPLKAGAVWMYRIDENRSLEMKCDKVENGEATITTTAQGRSVAKETIKVAADGIFRTKINDLAVTPPIKMLALPAKKGDTWEVKSKVQEKEISGKMSVKDDKEKLKLKDGKEFECVMVDGPEFKVDGTNTKVKMWFAPGKGIVKLSYEIGGQEATLELAEYKDGGK